MRLPRWKIDKANWELFQELSRNRFEQLHKEAWADVDELNKGVVTAVIKSTNESIPKASGCRKEKNMPWCDENCRQAIRLRNGVFRLLVVSGLAKVMLLPETLIKVHS